MNFYIQFFILEFIPTVDVLDFMGHLQFSLELIEGKTTIYSDTSVVQKCQLWFLLDRVYTAQHSSLFTLDIPWYLWPPT